MFDIVVFLVAGFLLPALFFTLLTDRVSVASAQLSVVQFSENVSTKGYISVERYESLLKELNASGSLVQTEFHVEHELLAPEYRMCSVEDAEAYLESLYIGSNVYAPGTISSERPPVSDPGVPPLGVIEATVTIPTTTEGISAAHTHGTGCYAGHNHTASGCSYHSHTSSCICYGRIDRCYWSTSCTSCGGDGLIAGAHDWMVTSNVSYGNQHVGCSHINKKTLSWTCYTCRNCGITYYNRSSTCTCGMSSSKSYMSSSTEHDTGTVSVPSSCSISCSNCGGDGFIQYYECSTCGSGSSTTSGGTCYAYRCGQSGSYSCGYTTNDVTPLCGQIVRSLIPIAPKQALSPGAAVDARVKAFFLDGHSAIANATVSGFNGSECNTIQTVTLSYGNYKDSLSNPIKSTCTVEVTVRCFSEVCENGHLYYLVDGEDTPCPYCRAYPKIITVLGADTVPLVITKGSSLQENGIQLLVTYYDGHSEIISNGYTDNLSLSYVGLQNVVIGYLGATTTLQVETTRIKVPCGKCGYEYSLYPDDSDPGCPRCFSAIPYYTGNTLRYKETVSIGEILDELYNGSGVYYFSRGDRLELKLWRVGESATASIIERFFQTVFAKELVCSYGVTIRDESERQ